MILWRLWTPPWVMLLTSNSPSFVYHRLIPTTTSPSVLSFDTEKLYSSVFVLRLMCAIVYDY